MAFGTVRGLAQVNVTRRPVVIGIRKEFEITTHKQKESSYQDNDCHDTVRTFMKARFGSEFHELLIYLLFLFMLLAHSGIVQESIVLYAAHAK